MRRTIAVHLGKEEMPLGTLFHDQQGARESAAFEYGAQWLASASRFAIEPGLSLVAGPQFHRKTREGSVFHAALADTEPDGWGRRVIQRDHAKRRQEARRAGASVEARPLNALDYLLAVDDFSRVGALRLKDEEGRYQRAVEEGARRTPPLVELERLLSATRAVMFFICLRIVC